MKPATEITTHTLEYNIFRDAYKDFNKSIQAEHHPKGTKNSKNPNQPKRDEWSHKQLCFQHKLYPELIQKHFTHTEMPPHLFKICQCGLIKKTVKNSYKRISRLSLDKALAATSSWKLKPAHFTDLNIKITDDSTQNAYVHDTIQMVKIKIGAVKRYTQPKTNKDLFATATFHQKSVFWQLGTTNQYILEMRLKTRCKDKVAVDENNTAKDVAKWWYQCWGLHGIKFKDSKDSSLTQFFAIHNNTFVHKTSLWHNLERVCLSLYVRKENMNSVSASVNGVSMVTMAEMERNSHSNSKRKRSPNAYGNSNSQRREYSLSQNSSQGIVRSQTVSPSNSQTLSGSVSYINGFGNGCQRGVEWERDISVNDGEMECEDMSEGCKDREIERLRRELRKRDAVIREKEDKIERLVQQNHDLTASLGAMNRDFVPLSGELRLSQGQSLSQSQEPPMKKRRLSPDQSEKTFIV